MNRRQSKSGNSSRVSRSLIERALLVDRSTRRSLFIRELRLYIRKSVVNGFERQPDAWLRTMVRFRSNLAGKIVHVIELRFGCIAKDHLIGAGYSSLARGRRTGSVQFSSVRPFTRPNSAVFFVTSLSPRLRA
jgi:hypothetical protein